MFRKDLPPQNLFIDVQRANILAELAEEVRTAHFGLLLLAGSHGIGSSSLARRLVYDLQQAHCCALLSAEKEEGRLDFYNQLAEALELDQRFSSRMQFLMDFGYLLRQLSDTGKRLFLVVDEAQRLSQEQLDDIRFLANIEQDQKKMVTILLVGDEGLLEKLALPRNKALAKALGKTFRLTAFDQKTSLGYCHHKLRLSGYDQNFLTDDAHAAIFAKTGGVAGEIDALAELCCKTIEEKELEQVDGGAVAGCLSQEAGVVEEDDEPSAKKGKRVGRTRKGLVLGLVVVFLVAGISYLGQKKDSNSFPPLQNQVQDADIADDKREVTISSAAIGENIEGQGQQDAFAPGAYQGEKTLLEQEPDGHRQPKEINEQAGALGAAAEKSQIRGSGKIMVRDLEIMEISSEKDSS